MEQLKHECGVALIRLLKPQDYYKEKYGTAAYGLGKLYLMMEKQHNRGQEGAGIACVDMNAPVGSEYMFRERALGKDAITEVFERLPKEEVGRGLHSIWDTCATARQARAACSTFILSCAATTGGHRISVFAATLT